MGKVATKIVTDSDKFKKRRQTVFNKAKNLATLADVSVSVIYCENTWVEPIVWTNESESIQNTLKRFREEGKIKQDFNLSRFLQHQKIRKEKEQKGFLPESESEEKYPCSDQVLDGFSEEELLGLVTYLGDKISVLKEKLNWHGHGNSNNDSGVQDHRDVSKFASCSSQRSTPFPFSDINVLSSPVLV